MIIPLLQKSTPGQIHVTDFKPSSVIKRERSDIWINPIIMEGVANLVALTMWLDKGEFDDVRSAEESFAGGVNPAEIEVGEPSRFLGFCIASLNDRAAAAVAAIAYGSANTVLDRVADPSIAGLKSFFHEQLEELERFYPQLVKESKEAFARPGILDGFYASPRDVTSGSKAIRLRSFSLGKMSPSITDAPDFIMSPALTLEEGFRLMTSPPIGRMRSSAYAAVSSDLNALVTALDAVIKSLSSGNY